MDISEQRQKQFMEEGLIDNLPQTLFQKNRNQFIKMFREAYEQANKEKQEKPIALFKGASEVPVYSSDVTYPEY